MKTYLTTQGDMWDSVSHKLYGSEMHVAELIAANPEHVNVSVFGGNVPLRVPEIEPAPKFGLPPWRR